MRCGPHEVIRFPGEADKKPCVSWHVTLWGPSSHICHTLNRDGSLQSPVHSITGVAGPDVWSPVLISDIPCSAACCRYCSKILSLQTVIVKIIMLSRYSESEDRQLARVRGQPGPGPEFWRLSLYISIFRMDSGPLKTSSLHIFRIYKLWTIYHNHKTYNTDEPCSRANDGLAL